ncbi:MAG: thiamine pyrophosphate-binding protein [Candidatus Omnitrophota bacterium]
MKLSDFVVDFLATNNIRHVFEVCGGTITHLLDSLYKRKDIRAISMHHEQAAAYAAEGYARCGSSVGVAMATSGPGATNLITGIASCFFDSIPCLFITGQVNTYEFKFASPIRQRGFQETDIVSMVRPVVKDAVLVREPIKIRYYLEKSLYLCTSGRPGPVLLDIPMNVQRADIDLKAMPSFEGEIKSRSKTRFSHVLLGRIARLIASSSRPVILVGGGVRLSGAQNELLKLVNVTGIPVVTTLMGIDAFPHDAKEYAGMIGTYGNRYANLTTANADMLLVLGARLDTRQTGVMPETFSRGAKIVRVDIDSNELECNKVKANISVNGDIREFLSVLNGCVRDMNRPNFLLWKKRVAFYKKNYPCCNIERRLKIHPNYFFSKLSEYIPSNAIICVDVGQHQMWAAQSLNIKNRQRFLTQGGMGSMGSSLAMAIGAAFCHPRQDIFVITGDGGFQLNIQELQTIRHYKLPIKIIMLNNHCYGMVRQFQEQYFHSRFQSSVIGYSCPDFHRVIKAYQIPTVRISRHAQLGSILRTLSKSKDSLFIEVDVDADTKVLPKLSMNRPIEDQDPLLSRKELKSNMFIDIL